jgi:hypothetical protein
LSQRKDERCCTDEDAIDIMKNDPLGHSVVHNVYEKKTVDELVQKLKCKEIDLSYLLFVLQATGFIESDEVIAKEDLLGITLSRNFLITEKGKKELEKIHRDVNCQIDE